jgi:cyclin H
MRKTVESIKDLIQRTGDVPPLEVVREVDRRLRLCKNPEKVPGSKAWLARKAEEERLQAEKRNRKAEASRRAMDADDPFREPGADASVGGENRQGDLDDDDDD